MANIGAKYRRHQLDFHDAAQAIKLLRENLVKNNEIPADTKGRRNNLPEPCNRTITTGRPRQF